MARIAILLSTQSPNDRAEHYVSRSLAALILCDSIMRAERLSKSLVWVRATYSFSDIKLRFRRSHATQIVIPRILPPRNPEGLVLSYPPKPYESDGKKRQAELWMRPQACPPGCSECIHKEDAHKEDALPA